MDMLPEVQRARPVPVLRGLWRAVDFLLAVTIGMVGLLVLVLALVQAAERLRMAGTKSEVIDPSIGYVRGSCNR